MPVTGLGPEDRHILARWLCKVGPGRIDTALDLSDRDWNVPGARAIIGLYEPACSEASWLAVADETGWTLLDCASSRVTGRCDGLADVLALIPA